MKDGDEKDGGNDEERMKDEKIDTSVGRATEHKPTTCPLGFGSRDGPQLGTMHCIVCKSLMYNAVVTNCGHRFCRECVEKLRDCPVCGADVDLLEEDLKTQEAIERFIETHAGYVSFWDLEEGIQLDMNSETRRDVQPKEKAYFLLQAGIRALQGGNAVNAQHRFEQCAHVLRETMNLSESNSTSNSRNAVTKPEDMEMMSQLGAVYGCIGDCERAKSHPEEAVAWYAQSIETLKHIPRNKHTIEALHTLSITLNKIGEVYHTQGNIRLALDMYKEALSVRQECMSIYKAKDVPIDMEVEVSLELDVAISRAKIADAMHSLGDMDDARKEMAQLQTGMSFLEPRMKKVASGASHQKYQNVAQFLKTHGE